MTQFYLPTHPSRGFIYGDVVMHCGTNINQRGRIGKMVVPNVVGKVSVMWKDSIAINEYSMDFALNNFAVDLYSLKQVNSHFRNTGYIYKYANHAIERENVFHKDFEFVPHKQMKRMRDGMDAVQNIKENILQQPKQLHSFIAVSVDEHNRYTPVAYGQSIEEIQESLEQAAEQCDSTGEYVIMQAVKKIAIKPVRNFSVSCEDL